MRLLLVEDDPMLGAALRQGLQQDGHAVDWARTRAEADTAWLASTDFSLTYDAVVLDLGLPDGAGVDLLRKARARQVRTPVLIATARDRVADRVAGLDAGADDYMVKPIDLEELSARLRALARRHAGRAAALITAGEIRIDPATREVWRADEPVELTAREYAVLMALARHPGALLTRAQIAEALYGWDDYIESNAVEVYIHHLRRKLGSDSIQNQRGLGYRLATGLGAT
ncbi:MAG: response regulator transcription factor [Lysobacterales bacterium]